jgi:fucose permease
MKPKYEKECTTITKSNSSFSYLFLIPLALGILLDLVVELGTNSWLPTFLTKSNRTSYIEAGIVLSFFWAMFSVGRLVSGKIADRYGFTKLLLIFSSLGAFAGLFALLAKGLIANIVAWGLVGLSIAPTYPIIMAIVYRRFTSSAGSVIGKIVTVGYAGSALIAPIFGTIDSILGPVYATSLIPLSSIGLMILFYKLRDTN